MTVGCIQTCLARISPKCVLNTASEDFATWNIKELGPLENYAFRLTVELNRAAKRRRLK